MIDEQGFRANVGIVLCNAQNQVLWAHRLGEDEQAWQFPQGGIHLDEDPEAAMYRELHEEIGLMPSDVELLGKTADWLAYRFDRAKLTAKGLQYIGQKQLWFLLRLLADDSKICLTIGEKPEFDAWRWVDYGYPVEHIVVFKRDVYRQALGLLQAHL